MKVRKQQSKWPKSAETKGGKDSIFTAENVKMSSATLSDSAIHGWLWEFIQETTFCLDAVYVWYVSNDSAFNRNVITDVNLSGMDLGAKRTDASLYLSM